MISLTKFFRKLIGKTNKSENIFIKLFIISIIVGIVYGVVDQNYYKCCESDLDVQEGENVLTIFSSNLLLSRIEYLTAGISSIYINFNTFATASSYLHFQNALYVLPFLFIHGFPELLGALLFSLAGLSLLERKFLKRKSNLKWFTLLKYGTVFLIIAAAIEIGLFYLLS